MINHMVEYYEPPENCQPRPVRLASITLRGRFARNLHCLGSGSCPLRPRNYRVSCRPGTRLARDEAWARFVARFSPLLLHTARTVAREHDRSMDAYAHLLDLLRQDDCRRLKQYQEDSGAQFTTWLVVVARRLCVDFLRQRYGRAPTAPSRTADHATRRRLEDLVAVEIGEMAALTEPRAGPDETLRRRELHLALQASLAQLAPGPPPSPGFAIRGRPAGPRDREAAPLSHPLPRLSHPQHGARRAAPKPGRGAGSPNPSRKPRSAQTRLTFRTTKSRPTSTSLRGVQ